MLVATLSVGIDSLTALAKRPGLVAEFPFLAPLAQPASGGCGGCGDRPARPGWRAAADALFSMSVVRKAQFKAAVGVTTVVRRVVRGGRLLVQEF